MSSAARMAILASGRGSNAGALLAAIAAGRLPASVACVVSDVPDAGVLAIARAAGVRAVSLTPGASEARRTYDARLATVLAHHNVDIVVCAGWMRILSGGIVRAYRGRMLNVHPSLLPAFPGMDAIGQALRAGVPETGVTVHLVDEGIDTGPVLAQLPVPIRPTDDLSSLSARIQRVEHRLLPDITARLINGAYSELQPIKHPFGGTQHVRTARTADPARTPVGL